MKKGFTSIELLIKKCHCVRMLHAISRFYGCCLGLANGKKAGDPRQKHSGMTDSDYFRMMTLLAKRMTTLFSKGFTLIELLVVVLIIGILAAVALPKYRVAVAKARAVEARNNLLAIVKAQTVYYMANGVWTEDLNELDVQLPKKLNWNYYCRNVTERNYMDCGIYVPKTNMRFLFQIKPEGIYQRCVALASSKEGQSVCIALGGTVWGKGETDYYYDLL